MMKIESDRKAIWVPTLWGTGLGLLVGVVFGVVAVNTYCGVCPQITPAEALFPYALLIDPSVSDWAPPLAALQWPLYGATVGIAARLYSKKKALLIICFLVILHLFSSAEANRRVNDWWASKLNSKAQVNAGPAI